MRTQTVMLDQMRIQKLSLRAAALAFAREHSVEAGVGPEQAVDRKVRVCRALDLLGPGVSASLPPPSTAR